MTVSAYRCRLLTPRTDSDEIDYLDDAVVVVGAGGRIEEVGPFAARSFRGPLLDFRPSIMVPGFVDAHVHYPQTRIVGSASGELLEWLERSVFPEEARFNDETYARAVAGEFSARALLAGTTSLGVFSSSSARATEVLFEE